MRLPSCILLLNVVKSKELPFHKLNIIAPFDVKTNQPYKNKKAQISSKIQKTLRTTPTTVFARQMS